ncbi:MAG: flagellar FlbD family protein [Anaerolineales bacterium]
MIKLTRLNQSGFVLNHALIKFLESRPDTTITLLNDEKVVVKEPLDEVIDRVVEYERRVRMFKE